MKRLYGICLVLVSTMVLAQDFQGLNDADMHKMMEQAKQMQACMGNVDRSKLKELENKGRQLEAKIKELCSAGKRDEAFSTAMREGLELSNDPTVKEMRKCGEKMPDLGSMVPDMPYGDVGSGDGNGDPDRHICD